MTEHEHREYDRDMLGDVVGIDPLALFDRWLDDAVDAGLEEPTAMTLATMDEFGPDARVVLMRGRDDRGFRFFTNYRSAKGLQLAGVPRAACVFHWQPLERQVRVRGPIERLDAADSDAYWADRPHDSRVASAMSDQSRPIASRADLQAQMDAALSAAEGRDVPRPEDWGGYRVVPHEIEFWQGRPARLHDRLLFTHHGDRWDMTRLQP